MRCILFFVIFSLFFKISFAALLYTEQDEDANHELLGGGTNPYWSEVDLNNPPKCRMLEDYFSNKDAKIFNQCATAFLQKLQSALKVDDKKAIYKMLGKNCEWYRCKKKEPKACRNHRELRYFILIKTEQDFIRNYHLIFNEKMKNILLAASVYDFTLGCYNSSCEEPFIKIGNCYLLLNNDFSIGRINDQDSISWTDFFMP